MMHGNSVWEWDRNR